MTTSTPRIRGRSTLLAIALIFAAGGIALAAGVAYDSIAASAQADGGAATWYRTGLTGNDSRVSATPVDRQPIANSEAYVKVKVRGSVGSGAQTACIVVYTAGVSGTLDDIAGIQTATVLVDNLGDGYLAEPLYFPVDGEHYYDVRCVAVSSGTVDLKVSTCGSASVVAE